MYKNVQCFELSSRNCLGKDTSEFSCVSWEMPHNSSHRILCIFYSSTVNSKCSSLDDFNLMHSELNGVADWRRKSCSIQQHPEHCTVLDQVFIFHNTDFQSMLFNGSTAFLSIHKDFQALLN